MISRAAAVRRDARTRTWPGSTPPSVAVGTRAANRLGDLRFDAVTYAYPGGPDVLHGISTVIGERESIGIVGPSGAGKSTLLDLLLRMRRPASGVLRDSTGGDVNDIRPEDWARLVAYVPRRR